MSVVGPNQNQLFCEGKPNSLDYLVLDRLKQDFNLRPIGSKNGLFNFVDGFTTARQVTGRLIAFRDRDFDAEPSNTVKLLSEKPSGNLQVFLSHRTSIENYLLDPVLIHRYWEESATGPKWTHKHPPPIGELKSWIEEAARNIADYQAIRWALNKLRPGARWPNVRNTWTDGSGKLPSVLDFDTCMASALELIKQFRMSVLPVNHKSLKRHAENYRQRFRDSQFWAANEYLVWFQGKDIQKAMSRARHQWISLDPYFEWAAQNLNWQQHPDLVELNQMLNTPAMPHSQ